ncbi:putative Laccase 1 [Seiridium unicorne]|uniref:laccase n=1 Tax=Seiridium unicorne TaxID=138068 RepID=A0ABR2V8S3_9PEZI
MLSLLSLKGFLSGVLLAGIALAAPATQDLDARQSTCNTASNRRCWTSNFDITTDYESSTPPGGSVSYNLEITEVRNWKGPDGVVKNYVQLINGQYPGPTLFAKWGDTITVTVKNSLPTNGTSIHWHGLRQLGTNIQDGVNGVTECALAPGKTKTYHFKATQYGTTWYHSHFSAQYGNGVWGTIVIDGPASNNYDIDLGVFPINDYYYDSADDIVLRTQSGGPPASDNVLFNGTNINPLKPTDGQYAVVKLTAGKRHRLRLINPSVEHNYQVSLVGHDMTIIATDLVPVNSMTVNNVYLGTGQRYDVLIDASQAVGNYWFNVTLSPTNLCGASVNPRPAAIFRYNGAPATLPSDPGTAVVDAACQDRTDFTPVVTRTADQTNLATELNDPAHNLDISLNFTTPVTWYVNSSAIDVQWDKPVLDYVLTKNTLYPRKENLVFVDEKNVWTYWVVQNLSPIPHPMHLHGHDFLVLGHAASTTFTTSLSSSLNFNNPTRRDVTMLPALGYLILAFKADNPGNWLMHCHIAWHVSGGLAVDFMERRAEQAALINAADLAAYQQQCADWRAYQPKAPPKIDSGI